MMLTRHTALNCCGLKEMAYLSAHITRDFNTGLTTMTPKDCEVALMDFCDSIRSGSNYDTVYADPFYFPNGVACGGVLFTQAITIDPTTRTHRSNQHRYAEEMKKFIEDSKLGVVHELPQFINPNTTRRIDTFLWIVDKDAVKNWWTERARKRFEAKQLAPATINRILQILPMDSAIKTMEEIVSREFARFEENAKLREEELKRYSGGLQA